jgi:hypothetical protein
MGHSGNFAHCPTFSNGADDHSEAVIKIESLMVKDIELARRNTLLPLPNPFI